LEGLRTLEGGRKGERGPTREGEGENGWGAEYPPLKEGGTEGGNGLSYKVINQNAGGRLKYNGKTWQAPLDRWRKGILSEGGQAKIQCADPDPAGGDEWKTDW